MVEIITPLHVTRVIPANILKNIIKTATFVLRWCSTYWQEKQVEVLAKRKLLNTLHLLGARVNTRATKARNSKVKVKLSLYLND
jgi:hypothetical protein